MAAAKIKIAKPNGIEIGSRAAIRHFVDDSFDRITGARLIGGNAVRLLVDATENYPAWMDAIENARERIYFESYIIHDDEQGYIFADALIKKAIEGVEVKLIYDWLGGVGKTSRSYWRHLRNNGIEVRRFNPPSFLDPLAILNRDHRKTLVVDGQTAFISGLCIGEAWIGDPEKGIPPWRDTGVQVTGPAVADVEDAFANVWAAIGSPLERTRHRKHKKTGAAGSVALRIVQSEPGKACVYRTDQLLAASARETMWISDAYFVGIPSYLQSLKDAAGDGVDVRILVPQATDIMIVRDTTRSTYRPLIEAGVRVFEWNGPMMHAKTAVFDGKFSRVGSTNLNISSWFGNYELDVLVEDEGFGRQMQEMFVADLAGATEIVLEDTFRKKGRKRPKRIKPRTGTGSVRKATAGALNVATSLGAAMTNRVPLGAAESRLLFIVGTLLLLLAALLIKFPRGASTPFVVLLLLFAIPTLIKGIRAYWRQR